MVDEIEKEKEDVVVIDEEVTEASRPYTIMYELGDHVYKVEDFLKKDMEQDDVPEEVKLIWACQLLEVGNSLFSKILYIVNEPDDEDAPENS